jgi:hypothetical protein
MKQSRAMSGVEAVVNVIVGYGLAVLTQLAVFPLFGLNASLGDNLAIGGVFALVAVVRSFALRRLFEAVRAGKVREKAAERDASAA